MRIGIIGDIHAEAERLERVLGWFARERVDPIAFVGDVVDGRGDLARCCALLEAAGAIGVRGNHERWFLTDTARGLPDVHLRASTPASVQQFVGALPATRTLSTPLGPLLLCHGMGANDMAGLKPDDTGYALAVNDHVQTILEARAHSLVIAGHTHVRMVRVITGITFINAGALVDPDPCAVILDCAARCVTFVDARDPTIVLDELPI